MTNLSYFRYIEQGVTLLSIQFFLLHHKRLTRKFLSNPKDQTQIID